MHKDFATVFLYQIIRDMNSKKYDLKNFDRDAKCLGLLLNLLNLNHLKDDLDSVFIILSKDIQVKALVIDQYFDKNKFIQYNNHR